MTNSTSFTIEVEKKLASSVEAQKGGVGGGTQRRGLSIKGSCRRQWLLKQVDNKRKIDENDHVEEGKGPEEVSTQKSTFEL